MTSHCNQETKLKKIKTGKQVSENAISYKIYQENKSELVCHNIFVIEYAPMHYAAILY